MSFFFFKYRSTAIIFNQRKNVVCPFFFNIKYLQIASLVHYLYLHTSGRYAMFNMYLVH